MVRRKEKGFNSVNIVLAMVPVIVVILVFYIYQTRANIYLANNELRSAIRTAEKSIINYNGDTDYGEKNRFNVLYDNTDDYILYDEDGTTLLERKVKIDSSNASDWITSSRLKLVGDLYASNINEALNLGGDGIPSANSLVNVSPENTKVSIREVVIIDKVETPVFKIATKSNTDYYSDGSGTLVNDVISQMKKAVTGNDDTSSDTVTYQEMDPEFQCYLITKLEFDENCNFINVSVTSSNCQKVGYTGGASGDEYSLATSSILANYYNDFKWASKMPTYVNGSTIISTLEYELEAINSKSAFATPAHELAKAVTTEVTDVVRTNKDQRAH